jgi:UDP-N-acetylglucosamine:LPS N-acetylglucosamine transferase
VVFLSEGDRKQVENALLFIDRIAATLARHEDVELKAQELAKAQEALEQDNDVIEIIHQVAEQGKPAAAAK